MTMEQPTATLPWVARCLLAGQGRLVDAAQFGEANGAPSSALRIVKAGAATTLDSTWAGALTDYQGAVRAFQESLKTQSVFFRLKADSALRPIPMNTRVGISSANATGWIVGEGNPVPLTRLTLVNQVLTPIKAAALIVATNELVRDVSAAGQALLSGELKAAAAYAVDRQFIDLLVDTNTEVISSSGVNSDAITSDLRSLLFAVNATGNGNAALYFLVSPGAAKAAATMPLLFPNMTPSGGEMFGVTALVSNAVDEDTIVLIDANGIGGDAGPITLKASNEADIDFADNPTGDGGQMVSLFQTNATALMAVTSFAAERLRDDAVAVLQGIDWGTGTA
jgi:Phage capsid family